VYAKIIRFFSLFSTYTSTPLRNFTRMWKRKLKKVESGRVNEISEKPGVDVEETYISI
jgi:hypothetical protein